MGGKVASLFVQELKYVVRPVALSRYNRADSPIR